MENYVRDEQKKGNSYVIEEDQRTRAGSEEEKLRTKAAEKRRLRTKAAEKEEFVRNLRRPECPDWRGRWKITYEMSGKKGFRT